MKKNKGSPQALAGALKGDGRKQRDVHMVSKRKAVVNSFAWATGKGGGKMKKGTRKDTRLNLRVAPLYAFYFKKYAEHQNLNLKQAFSDAVSCLVSSGIGPDRQKKWLREYVKMKGPEHDALD